MSYKSRTRKLRLRTPTETNQIEDTCRQRRRSRSATCVSWTQADKNAVRQFLMLIALAPVIQKRLSLDLSARLRIVASVGQSTWTHGLSLATNVMVTATDGTRRSVRLLAFRTAIVASRIREATTTCVRAFSIFSHWHTSSVIVATLRPQANTGNALRRVPRLCI
jgi:hypothetical protein